MPMKPDMARLGPSHSTVPELFLWDLLRDHPYAVFNDGLLPGTPDVSIDIGRTRFAVFADGRHWHDPKTAALHQRAHHQTDWIAKARRNQQRDRKVNRLLYQMGFAVLRVWDDAIMKDSLWTALRVLVLFDRHRSLVRQGSQAAGIFYLERGTTRVVRNWFPSGT